MSLADRHASKKKLLDAAFQVIRAKGYAATTIDDLCAAANVTKGSFFHHFKTKEQVAVEAAEYWSEVSGALFATAPYHRRADPLDRVLGYIEFRKELLRGRPAEYSCLVGTMLQEVYDSHPAIREAGKTTILDHAATLEADIAAAVQAHGLHPEWSASTLALHTQAVIQGAFILAKATGATAVAADCIDHLHRYVALLFNRSADVTSERSPNAAARLPYPEI